MPILLVGLSHTTAPVPLRERLYFSDMVVGPFLERLCALPGICEAVILSTCNRTEIYAYGEAAAEEELVGCLAARARISAEELRTHLYVREGRFVASHLFRVACGLDSLMIGEMQILGQVREALAKARQHGTAGRQLGGLLEQAVAVGKRARAETGISEGAFSVGRAAVEMARTHFPQLEHRAVLLLGAGKMSELTAKHLAASGAQAILVANRTHAHAVQLAERLQGRAIFYEEMERELVNVDIMISSTSAPHFMLCARDVARVMAQRQQRPLCLIDIAIPRDIEPAVGDLPHVYLYNVDDLRSVTVHDRCKRASEMPKVEEIIADEVEKWRLRYAGLHAAPVIAALRDSFETVRRAELARMAGVLDTLSPAQRQAVEQLTSSIINKILHVPTVRLKDAVACQQESFSLDALAELFIHDGVAVPGRNGDDH